MVIIKTHHHYDFAAIINGCDKRGYVDLMHRIQKKKAPHFHMQCPDYSSRETLLERCFKISIF